MKKEINREDYLALKEKRFSDAAIIAFFGISRWRFDQWKKEAGLTGYRLQPRRNHKLDQKKKRFLELYRQGLDHESIAREMNMSSTALGDFKTDHFPELKRKPPRYFTKQELKMMDERGLTRAAMRERMKKMSFDEAIKIPPKDPAFSFTDEQKRIMKRFPISRATVRSRMLNGMTFLQAISTPRKTGNQHTRKGATG